MANEQSVLAVIRAARPTFRNSQDKVAFAVHATFLAAGYVLHATGPAAFSDNALSSTSTSDEVGIDQWNELEDDYSFIYSHPDKGSKKVLVKCLTMNDKLMVDALSDDGTEPLHLEISIGDYNKDCAGNYASQYKDLRKLVTAVHKGLLDKLSGASAERSSAQTTLSTPPSSSESRNVEVNEPPLAEPYPAGIVYPPINPVPGSDLYPGPGAGMYPSRGDTGGGGGSLVGPDHPMFGRVGIGRGPTFPGGLPGVPPGARFDPYGPPGVPGFEPNRFIRDPRGPGRGTHPDLEHFRDDSDYI